MWTVIALDGKEQKKMAEWENLQEINDAGYKYCWK